MEEKYQKLLLSIVLDLVGMIPMINIIWAPISGFIMIKMYSEKNEKLLQL